YNSTGYRLHSNFQYLVPDLQGPVCPWCGFFIGRGLWRGGYRVFIKGVYDSYQGTASAVPLNHALSFVILSRARPVPLCGRGSAVTKDLLLKHSCCAILRTLLNSKSQTAA